MQSGPTLNDLSVALADPYWLLPILFGFTCSLVVCHFATPIGQALGLMDDPAAKTHSRHTKAVPLVGGLAVLLPVVLLGLVAGAWAKLVSQPTYWDVSAVFAAAIGALTLIGLLDDRYHLSVRSRLLVTSAVFIAVVGVTPEFRIEALVLPFVGVAVPVTFGWAAAPFTVLCLVGLANAVNMADGRNGLVLGMALIWTLAFISASPAQLPRGNFMLLASLLIAFVYNMRGKLFLGDGGTYGLATCFGLTAIWFHRFDEGILSESQIASLFLIPALDMVRLIFSRLRRGVSPFAADHGHLHHCLDDWLGWNRGLLVYLALVAMPIVLAFTVPNLSGEALLLGAACYLVVLMTARYRRPFADHAARGMPAA